ncbi:MAG TPA: AMP-binding protein, partial [Longimicrobium sp.]|nr:AMP-binding protein [Longimicrobium sp.]
MTKPSMLEDVYPLSPTQEGMLFHSLNDQGSGTYVGQFAFRMAAALDEDAFVRAWQAVVDRHPVLRSGLSWEKVDAPLQVVRREARLPVRREDWRGRTASEQRAALDAFLAEDRARGFDLARAPLMRLALFRTGEAERELVWTHHHVIVDGWSLGLVYRDVLVAYEAFAAGREPRFAPAPRYRDFVAWIRARDEGAAEAFWRRALAGFAAPTPLGVGRAPAADAPADSAQLLLRAAPETLAALESLARRARTTLGTVVQGAWALLLARYAGEDDVVFGAVTAGRPSELAGAGETVGLFVNTVPVRVRVPGVASILPWLEGLQREQAALREHEHTPLARVQGWSEVPRGQPLFESVLSFQNFRVDAAPGAADRFGVRSFRAVEVDEAPLILAVSPGAEGLALNLGYHRARFTDAEAAGILRHLRTVLEAFAAAPLGRLADVSLLYAEERAQVLATSRGAAAGYPAAGVHEVIARRAAAWPDAPAVVDGARTLTYRALHAHADRLAARLRARGVGPETRVALFLERGAELAVALLAVLRAGGAYVPVDPGYPADRIAYLLGDCGARLVLTHPALAARLPADTAAPLLAVELDPGDLADGAASTDAVDGTGSTESPRSAESTEPTGSAESAESAESVVSTGMGETDPDALAYAIYTSGSTGRPKAAMISHRSLLCYAEAMAAELGLGRDDRFLQFASPSFDVMVEEIFPAWLSGAAVVFPPADLLESPDALLDVVEAHGVTGFELPTAFWHEWVRMLAEDGAGLPASVRFVIVGGERILPERLRQWAALGVPLVHVFGLTETSVTSTTLWIGAGEDASAHPNLPVGRPIANVETYVLDASMAPVPARVPGELYVGGDGVG